MNIERFTIRDEAQNRASHPNGEYVRFEDHQRALEEAASTQPVSESPGDSGVEKTARQIEGEAADARKAAASVKDPQAKAAHNGRAQALSWSAQNLRKLKLAAQPVPGNSGGVEEG